jgi:DHA2 family multidrug resistance protein-like MFS transporter
VKQKATTKEWIGLAIIALPCFVYAMDLTVLMLAVPRITEDLHPSSSEQLWIIDIYGFMVAGLLITMGMIGDQVGRRRLLLLGAVLFVVASIAAAFSTSAAMLIVNRAMLGIAGATIAPSTLSLIRNMFHDDKQRTVAVGIWITSYSAGSALGPLIGGLILQYFSWGAVFLAAIPVMILLLVLGPRFLPEFRDSRKPHIDFLSVFLSIASILLIVFGLKKIAEDGPGIIYIISIAGGMELGRRFLIRQSLIAAPLVDVRLLRGKAKVGVLLTLNLLTVFTAYGGYIYIVQYLQVVLGVSPLAAGMWTLPWSSGFIAGSLLTPKIVHRYDRQSVMIAGLSLAALAFFILAQISSLHLWAVVATSVLFAFGVSPVVTLLTDMVLSEVEPEKAGTAGALSETSSELGGALGIAILGSVGTAVYRNCMNNILPLSLETRQRMDATNSVGGAFNVAQQFEGSVRDTLVESARNSFISSMTVISLVNAAISIGLIFFVVRSLRSVVPGRE